MIGAEPLVDEYLSQQDRDDGYMERLLKLRAQEVKELLADETILWDMCQEVDHTDSWVAELQEHILNGDGIKARDVFIEARDEFASKMSAIIYYDGREV